LPGADAVHHIRSGSCGRCGLHVLSSAVVSSALGYKAASLARGNTHALSLNGTVGRYFVTTAGGGLYAASPGLGYRAGCMSL
jgi:hypothetical protein